MRVDNPTAAQAWLWIAGSFVFVLAATMLPSVGGAFAGPAMALALGVGSAWWVRSTPGASTTQAATSGAIAGLGAFGASVAAFAAYGASAGALVGVAAGLINLALSAIGGLVVGLSVPHGQTHASARPVPR